MTFSVAAPSVGAFVADPNDANSTAYTADDPTTGPVFWAIDGVDSSGSVTFTKTVYLDEPRIATGALADTATLTGSGGTGATAASDSDEASIDIDSGALVSLTINKTIPVVLGSSDGTETFTFPVTGPDSYTSSPTIAFSDGDGGSVNSKSTTLTGLAPGSYTVSETTLAPYKSQASRTVSIDLPSCSDSMTFTNNFGPATAQAKKVTVPAGSESGWTFTLTGPGAPVVNGSDSYPVTATTTRHRLHSLRVRQRLRTADVRTTGGQLHRHGDSSTWVGQHRGVGAARQ